MLDAEVEASFFERKMSGEEKLKEKKEKRFCR